MNPPGGDGSRPRRRLRNAAAFAAAVLFVSTVFVLEQRARQHRVAPSPARSPASATAGMSTTASETASGPPPPARPAAPGRWRLVFADDFAGDSLDPSRWVTCYDWNTDGCTNAGNHEIEWYLPEQVTVANGAATLTSVRRPTTGSGGKVYPWTSGMLSTGRPSWNARPRFTFTYGYAEASVKMPATAAMFSAFWLLSADETARSEVDVAEAIASETSVLMNLHWTTAAGIHLRAPRAFGPLDLAAGYHDFAVDWEPDGITWYIDGIARYAITDRRIIPAGPMELLFTLAVGFPGPPPANVSTASMSIEHVRVWQR